MSAVLVVALCAGATHHKYALSPDEYMFAALNMYLDIVSLFTLLLIMLGETCAQQGSGGGGSR